MITPSVSFLFLVFSSIFITYRSICESSHAHGSICLWHVHFQCPIVIVISLPQTRRGKREMREILGVVLPGTAVCAGGETSIMSVILLTRMSVSMCTHRFPNTYKVHVYIPSWAYTYMSHVLIGKNHSVLFFRPLVTRHPFYLKHQKLNFLNSLFV